MTKTTPHLTRAMQDVLSAMARAANAPLQTLSPADARMAYEAGTEVLEVPRLELNRVTNCVVPTRDGQHIKARLYRPASGLLPALMYLHGGGFVIGNIDTHDLLCRQLSHLAGCAVLSVDYRLAPEHRFPTAAHDAWDALQWLRANAETLQIDASRLAVGGDSAGGNLAAVCAVWARDAGLPLALQMLFYPCCAPHQDTPSHRRFSKGFVLEKDQLDWFFGHYLRTPADREDWRFAPLLAPDVDGVAPAWIGLAELDPLVDEGVMYGDKLRTAGVHVDLEIYRGVTHEFIKMGRVIPEAQVAHAHAAQALRKAFLL
jgi:acetyl esterase